MLAFQGTARILAPPPYQHTRRENEAQLPASFEKQTFNLRSIKLNGLLALLSVCSPSSNIFTCSLRHHVMLKVLTWRCKVN